MTGRRALWRRAAPRRRTALRPKALPFARRSADTLKDETADHATLLDGRAARLERAACSLCGDAGSDRLIPVNDWRYGLTDHTFFIVRCRRCGLAFLDPRPAREEMALFYPGSYYDRRRVADGDVPAGAAPPAKRIRPEALAEQAALCEEAGHRGRLLDVGCASGAFLAHMRDRGWQVEGVEISREAAGWGVQELGLTITAAALPEARLPKDRFDVVTYWSALEHVHDPRAYLSETHRILKPGGQLVLLVPNFASPTVRLLHWGLDPPRHLYHFTPGTLGKMLAAAGFTGRPKVRTRTGIEDAALHHQLAKIGRRLRRQAEGALAAAAGAALLRLSPLAAPVSWGLTLLGRGGAMIVTIEKVRSS